MTLMNNAFVVAIVLATTSIALAADRDSDWAVALSTNKEVFVKVPLADGKVKEPRTENGRRIYDPTSLVPIEITVTNNSKTPLEFAADDFELKLLDPRGKPLSPHSDYNWAEGLAELRADSARIEPGKSHTFKRALKVLYTTLEADQRYTLETGHVGQGDYAKTTFTTKVSREKGQPSLTDFFDAVVELHGGKYPACGVIFWYNSRQKEAYVLTAGQFIGDVKEFTVKVHYRDGKKLDKPEESSGRVVAVYKGEFAVVVFPLAARPRLFPLGDEEYRYTSHPELICVRWNEKEGMTARLVGALIPKDFTSGTISTVYAEPENGLSGAGLFDRDGRLVGVGWGNFSSPHAGNRLGRFLSLGDIYDFLDKAGFQLPSRGAIGITISATPERAGIFVKEVEVRGEAAKAGLKTGDIISAIDGVEVADVDRFIDIIRFSEGAEVALQVERRGTTVPITVKVGRADTNSEK